MKLKHIKLAGFKSFVDPTVLDLRSDLVSVVGPNGCGKSNVIDAVRWVMGESSAKTLRGESITDVIFNGSNTRKPIGRASVELIFDNSDGTIGGEYASYAEISVRREVNRDAVSNYYLNGTRCRRRDIIDAFLGTGIGSRSYSIIEQGMITRIIESKPEELRGFVEEAAGISVYKKRRHDTELRMRHTSENLDRLEDLREEQIKLLERLKRQAESAQKYKAFNSEKETLESQLLGVRWQQYDAQLEIHAEHIRNFTVIVEEKQAQRTTLNTDLEKVRLEHEAQQDVHNKIQSKYYELGSIIARNEQSLQHHKERRIQLEQDDEQVKLSISEITQQKETDSGALFECEERLALINPEYIEAVEASVSAEELYLDARLSLDTWNEDWEKFQESSKGPQQQAEVQKARIEHLDQQTQDLQSRIDRMQKESEGLDITGLDDTKQQLSAQQQELEESANIYKSDIIELQNASGAKRSDLAVLQDEINEIRSHVQQAKGRESSLQALQQAALNKDDKVVSNWLVQNNLQNAPRLAESIKVDAGWDLAVETVLADYLEAVCVSDNIDYLVGALQELTEGEITVIAGSDTSIPTTGSLAGKVDTDTSIKGLLQDILVADDLTTAFSMRGSLQPHQSIITKDGIWLNQSWLRVKRSQNEQRGVIGREQELKELKTDIDSFSSQEQVLEKKIHLSNEQLQQLEIDLTTKSQTERDASALLRECSSKLSACAQKLEHANNRKKRIAIECDEHRSQFSANSSEQSKSRLELEVAIEAMAGFAVRKEELLGSKESITAREKETKIRTKELSDTSHELEIEKQTVTTKYEGLQHTISRVDQQLSELHKRHQQILDNMTNDSDPVKELQAGLEQVLEDRVAVDKELQIARAALETIDAQMKEFEQKRIEIEEAADLVKEKLDKSRLERQSIDVRKETVIEQLEAASIDLQKVLENLPEEAAESEWSERIEALNRKISNLGAINLAAVEELSSETQRQEHLETQFNDLREALDTLENAIKKIDRETRIKFKDTFDKINVNFQNLFPKLFGGGKAVLEIVGDDLIDAGVSVMAMPPGKKNATIHLLSGGEKALTAVALVFAIFKLNPAPFCMLDEVDAPLDDTNVIRFGNLIKEMSKTVQFIIISHNKATMEIANQLIGVTMKEPGVSRLVSVDIGEAVEMAMA